MAQIWVGGGRRESRQGSRAQAPLRSNIAWCALCCSASVADAVCAARPRTCICIPGSCARAAATSTFPHMLLNSTFFNSTAPPSKQACSRVAVCTAYPRTCSFTPGSCALPNTHANQQHPLLSKLIRGLQFVLLTIPFPFSIYVLTRVLVVPHQARARFPTHMRINSTPF